MRRTNRDKPIYVTLLIGIAMAVPLPSFAQLHAGATVALFATVPSSVTLSDSQIPITIIVSHGTQTISDSAIAIKWNLDTRAATGFRIAATLVGSKLPATSLEVRTASATFRPLSQNGSIILLNRVVNAAKRQGELQTSVQLQFSDAALADLPDGVYQGWLKLQAQIL